MRPVRISDDRGRRVPLCTPDRLPAEAPSSVRARVERASAHTLRGISASLVGALIAAAILSLLLFVAGGWPRSGTVDWLRNLLVVVLTFVAVGTAMSGLHARRSGARDARQGCLESGACPSCGYGLRAIPARPDGCTVCPECGTGWRLPSVTPSHLQ